MKKRIQLLILLTIGLVKLGIAQNDKVNTVSDLPKCVFDSTFNDTVYIKSEKEPIFNGGEENMFKFLGETVNYPARAKENNIKGRVVLRFIITKEGKVQNIEVLSKDSHELLNNAVIEGVKLFPLWKPAEQNGKPVNCYFVLPFLFNLK